METTTTIRKRINYFISEIQRLHLIVSLGKNPEFRDVITLYQSRIIEETHKLAVELPGGRVMPGNVSKN